MEFAWRRALALLGMAVGGLWAVPCLAASDPGCAIGDIAAGQRTVTPSVVIGAPAERLVLKGHNPAKDEVFDPPADDGYVITGDKVEVVTHCDKLSYVRFHGKSRVHTGWVDTSRLQASGAAFVPLPANATALCHAAQDMLNAGGLDPVPMMRVAPEIEKKLPGVDEPAGIAEVARVTVDGREMAVVIIDDGGTAHTQIAAIFTPKLDSRLSPPDSESRRLENNGEETVMFGVHETLVMVRGQPMILEAGFRNSHYTLAAIDRLGDIVGTCSGSFVPVQQPTLEAKFDRPMCSAIVSGKGVTSPMHPPADGEALFLPHVPSYFEPLPQYSSPTVRQFRNGSEASEVIYTIESTGTVDPTNSGHPRRVSLVAFSDDDSTAGDGTYQEKWVRPVYLDAQGKADPDAPENERLARQASGDGMQDGRLVTYQNSTYLELASKPNEPIGEIWRLGEKGLTQVCGFRLNEMKLHVVTAEDHGPPG
jgi:hypothetical protein